MGLLDMFGGSDATPTPTGGGMFDAYSPQNQTNLQMAMLADIVGNVMGKDVNAMQTAMPLVENSRKLRLQNEQRTAAQNMLGGGGSGAGGSEWMTPQQKAAIASIARTNAPEAMKLMATMKMQYDSAGVAFDRGIFTQESGLRGEYQKLTKTFRDQQDSFGRIIQSAEPGPGGDRGAGDLALVFNYMKLLDPGSTVRESEFRTASNAAGMSERIVAAMERLDTGNVLSDAMRRDFVDRSWKLYGEAARGFERTSGEYVNLSERYQGVDPSRVVTSSRRYKEDWFNPWFQELGGAKGVPPSKPTSVAEKITSLINQPSTATRGASGRNRPKRVVPNAEIPSLVKSAIEYLKQ